MKKYSFWLIIISLGLVVQACALFGIHFNLKNPKKPGKLPEFSKEAVLLGEMSSLRSCYDVTYYELFLEFMPDDKTIDGAVNIHAVAQQDFTTLQLDLHPNFKIKSITRLHEDRELPHQREERAVKVELEQKKGQQFVLRVEYEGKPYKAQKPPWKGGFVWKKDKEKNAWLGVACESDGASVWWPLKDHTADEPDSVSLHYTVPKGLYAIGNGQLTGEETANDKTTFSWFVSYPINTYNITVYVGDFVKIQDVYKGINGKKLALDYYVLPKNEAVATEHFKQVHDILKVYEALFGEYPWYNDGFKLVESPYAGMEHQTAIAYGNGYKNDVNPKTDHIILHEVAHEWWGNSVTAKDLSDVWLQEGFATYAEALYLERMFNKDEYDTHLMLYRWFIKNKYPVVGVKDRRWFHFKKSSDVYVKGAWILHTLREQINDDPLFFDIIKSFYQTSKYQLVESKDFISVVNEKTGKDYNWFFEQYLHANKAPVLEYGNTPDGMLYYRWEKPYKGFDAFKVKLLTQNDTIVLAPTNKIQKLELPVDEYGGWNYGFLRQSLYVLSENKNLAELSLITW